MISFSYIVTHKKGFYRVSVYHASSQLMVYGFLFAAKRCSDGACFWLNRCSNNPYSQDRMKSYNFADVAREMREPFSCTTKADFCHSGFLWKMGGHILFLIIHWEKRYDQWTVGRSRGQFRPLFATLQWIFRALRGGATLGIVLCNLSCSGATNHVARQIPRKVAQDNSAF